MASLFSDFLSALKVRHTEDYSDRRFKEMPFQSMFGFSELLKEYGIGSVGIKVDDASKCEVLRKSVHPFLIDTPDGFLIIHSVDNRTTGQEKDIVTYESQHETFKASVNEIADAWNGIALLATPDRDSCEPEYTKHRIREISKGVKRWVLYVSTAVLLAFAMWYSGLYGSVAGWLAMLFNGAGIWLSWMLVLKSLGIKNKHAEAVCSALEEGGCDEIAKSEAASFMGIFKWSEVGLAYFSVSILAMLLFPTVLPALAAINILCLPYTVWSITYQKFKAKTWCTLCVCVQITLWLLFGSYLLGGWTMMIFPLTMTTASEIVILGLCYICALLGINALNDAIAKLIKTE